MHAVLDHSPIAAFTIDLADRITTWNAAAARYFDIPEPTARAGRFRDLDISYQVPGLRSAVEAMKLAPAPAALSLGTVRFVRRTGEAAEAVFAITPISLSGGLVGICIWTEDRAPRAALETTIETLSVELEGVSGEHEELQTINEVLKTSQDQLQELCVELERASRPPDVHVPVGDDVHRHAGADVRGDALVALVQDSRLVLAVLRVLRDQHGAGGRDDQCERPGGAGGVARERQKRHGNPECGERRVARGEAAAAGVADADREHPHAEQHHQQAPGDAALVERLRESRVDVREIPGRGLVRVSCGWWTSDQDLEQLAAGLAG